MKDILRKVTDCVTIVFPAVITILGIVHLTGAVEIAGTIEQIVMVALGAVSAIASVVYNKVAGV